MPDKGMFTWLLGGFFDHEKNKDIVDLFNYSNPQGAYFGVTPLLYNLPSSYVELAAFADGTYHFTPALDLTFGIRYSHDHQRYGQISSGLFNNPQGPFAITRLNAQSNEDVVSYLINPKYRANRNLQVYARVASSYRPGGPNLVLSGGLGNPTFSPDGLWNYEVGSNRRRSAGRRRWIWRLMT